MRRDLGHPTITTVRPLRRVFQIVGRLIEELQSSPAAGPVESPTRVSSNRVCNGQKEDESYAPFSVAPQTHWSPFSRYRRDHFSVVSFGDRDIQSARGGNEC
jgi:hypothetical protein